MSASLVRQSLDFVDRDKEDSKVGAGHKVGRKLFKNKNKKIQKNKKEQTTEEKIERLLALTKGSTNTSLNKIVERAIEGKPLADKIEVRKEEEKSILLDEEPVKRSKRKRFSR